MILSNYPNVPGVRVVPVPVLPLLQLGGSPLAQLGRPCRRPRRHTGAAECFNAAAADILPSDLKNDFKMKVSSKGLEKASKSVRVVIVNQ